MAAPEAHLDEQALASSGVSVVRAFTGVRFGGLRALQGLSTRERDLEDAAAVLRAIGPRIDPGELDREAALLAAEMPDHDIAGRLARARDLVNAVAP